MALPELSNETSLIFCSESTLSRPYSSLTLPTGAESEFTSHPMADLLLPSFRTYVNAQTVLLVNNSIPYIQLTEQLYDFARANGQTAIFIGSITVPGALILLGASFARLSIPKPWSKVRHSHPPVSRQGR